MPISPVIVLDKPFQTRSQGRESTPPYNGMPPEQIENDITGPFERFFTLAAANVDHIDSRSLPGGSLVKVYFKPGANPDWSVTAVSNLAMAQLSPNVHILR